MAEQRIEIRVTATGAEQAAKVLQDIAKEGGELGTVMGAGAKKAETALGALGVQVQQVSNVMAQAGISTGVLGQALAALTSPLGLAAAGFVAFGVTVTKALGSMAAQAQEIRKLQAVTGLGVEATDNLADTFKLLGVEAGVLTQALFKMSAEMENGGQTLRLLGLSVRDSSGALKAEGAIFLELRDRIAGMGSAAQRNALLMEIFGRAGRELAPIFALSRAEFMKWQDEASKLSNWTEESQKAAVEYSIAVNKLGLAWGDFWNQAGAAMAGPATRTLEFLTSAIQKTKEWTAALRERAAAGEGLGGLRLPGSPTGGEPFGGEPGAAPGAGPTIPIGALKAIEEYRKQLEVLRKDQLDQPIERINQAFKEFSEKWGPEAAAAMKPLTNELIGITRAAQAVPAQLEAMKARAADVSAILGEAQLLLDLKNVDDELKQLSVTLGANADAVQKDADAWREEAAAADLAAEALKRIAPLAAVLEAAFSPGGTRFTDTLITANRELRALQAATDLDADAIRRFGLSFKNLDEQEKAALLSLREWNAEAARLRGDQAFAKDLAAIGVQAQLLGPYFDASSAAISRMQQRLTELAALAGGTITPEMQQLGTAIQGMIDQKRLEEALGLTRTTFDQFVDLASATAQNMTRAFSDLFFNIFTGNLKSAADVFKSFMLSMLRAISNFLAERVTQQFLGFLFPKSNPAAAAAIGGGGGGGGGMNTAGFAPGEVGGAPIGATLSSAADAVGNFASGLNTAANGTTTFSNLMTGASNAWGAFNASLEAGEGVFHSLSGAFDSFMVPFSGAASALTVGLAGVGAAVAVFGTVMDFVNGKTEAAIGGVAGAAVGATAGGLIGSVFPGVGTVLGALVGGALGDFLGSFLGGLFGGGPTNYALKRIAAADEARGVVGAIGPTYATAARTGTSADALAALRAGQAPAGSTPNPIRTDLSIPPALAEQLGLAAKAELENGRAIVHWADVTQAQFDELITLFKTDPSMIQSAIVGKGDVGYLKPDEVKAYTDALQAGGQALLEAFTAYDSVRDQINGLATDIVETAKVLMPPDLAAQLAETIVNPIRDQMVAVIQTPNLAIEEMQKQLDKLGSELQSKVQEWGKFADALNAMDLVKASMPGDLGARMQAATQPAYDAVITAMRTGTAKQAQLAVDHFDKLAAAWITFGQSVEKAVDVENLLPGDLGARFKAKMDPQYEQILATLVAGNANLAAAQIAAFNRQMAAWAALGQTVTRISSEIMDLSDPSALIANWQAVQAQLERTATRAKTAFDAAIGSGDVERIAATSAAYHDATLSRLQAERTMVQQMVGSIEQGQAAVEQINAAVKGLLDRSATLVQTMTRAAQIGITVRGSVDTIGALLGALRGLAETGATVAEQVFAIEQAFQAMVAVLPAAIEQFAALQDKAAWLSAGRLTAAQLAPAPQMITGGVLSAAGPFLTAMQTLIDAAAGPDKLALLQQQANQWGALADAALAGVQQWAQGAIQGARDAADAVIEALRNEKDAKLKAIDLDIKGIQKKATLEHDARMKAIEAIQAQAEADAELRQTQMEALREQIQTAEQFESAIKGMAEFIQGLKVGPMGPGNPADKLRQAQDNFAKALATYTANPSAQGLTDLQGLAQTLLGLAEPIFSKPSPQFQALSATIIKQLTAAQALARAVTSDSAVLKAQLAALQALDKTEAKATREQIAAIQAADKAATEKADTLIDALNAQKEKITDDFETQTEAIEAAFRAQKLDIEGAAKTEADAISLGLAAALEKNAADQAPLLAAARKVQTDLLAAVNTGGGSIAEWAKYLATRQDDAIVILSGIKTAIESATGAATGMERVKEGLYHLHDDEMVIPKAMADQIRSAQEGAGLPSSTPDDWRSKWFQPRDLAQESRLWAGPMAAELNKIERDILLAQERFAGLERANTYKSRGKIYHTYTPAQLAAMEHALAAHVAAMRGQQSAILAAIPRSVTTPPPPGAPPAGPGAPTPGTGAPTPAPYVPPGPGWLTRTGGPGQGKGTVNLQISVEVHGTANGQDIGKAIVREIEDSARSGRLHEIILEVTG